ncbi:uncharacterized protein LOC123878163 [Maniola jurtina]|uniref:uncharacterized protein LOC123878163 n=1 Tax=Maniola jurtina TaxID=191418 RepID=UPI001E68A0DE|nr:uncharacterized protein LOC123878163 [Maniola jurtina]
MVIIAIENIPLKISLSALVKNLTPLINGEFEAFNFTHNKKGSKTAYIRLAGNLTRDVIKRINAKKIGPYQLKAFIPDNVADLPLNPVLKTVPNEEPVHSSYPTVAKPKGRLLSRALHNIMLEMQTIFTGLYRLSETSEHQLLETIGSIVYERLKHIKDDPSHPKPTCFHLTKKYRRRYPHDTDYEFIMQNYHAIQDALGKPRTNPKKRQLMALPPLDRAFSYMSQDTLYQMCNSEIERISQKLVGHVNGLEVKEETSTPEEAATMKVRKHLKDLSPHLPHMVRHVIAKHLGVDEKYCSVKIYGDRYLPSKEIMAPFTEQFQPAHTSRSEYMFNLLTLQVPREMYLKLLKADGQILNRNAKLMIRPGRLPFYQVKRFTEAPDLDESLPDEGQGTMEDQLDEEHMEYS